MDMVAVGEMSLAVHLYFDVLDRISRQYHRVGFGERHAVTTIDRLVFFSSSPLGRWVGDPR